MSFDKIQEVAMNKPKKEDRYGQNFIFLNNSKTKKEISSLKRQ